jgi:hypothetical protein
VLAANQAQAVTGQLLLSPDHQLLMPEVAAVLDTLIQQEV